MHEQLEHILLLLVLKQALNVLFVLSVISEQAQL